MEVNSFLIISLFFISFFVSMISTFLYRNLAQKFTIFAEPNFRSLHKSPISSGGGIIIASVYIASIIYFANILSSIFYQIAIGGIAIAIVGFIDDVKEIKAILKLIVQIIFSVWILFIFFDNLETRFEFLPEKLFWIAILMACFFLVWLKNVFNFMDGVDGMAISGSILIVWSAALTISIFHGINENALMLFILGAVCLGFSVFNFPPASIFMGDSGSLFLGYIVGCFFIKTIVEDDINIWAWLIILSHFLSETSLTTLLRIKLTKKWYKPHRSHAYQNLARIWGNHKRVTAGSIAYYLVWLFPLAYFSADNSEIGPILLLLAILPVIILTLKYGPLFSSD